MFSEYIVCFHFALLSYTLLLVLFCEELNCKVFFLFIEPSDDEPVM